MLFSSLTFIYIFVPLLCIFYFILKNNAYRRIVLTVFSLLFYAWGEPVFVLLILCSVFLNYLAGRLMEKFDGNQNARKTILIAGVIINLSALAFFKYTPLAVNTLNSIAGLSIPLPNVTMPIGISFYTFQAMSYMIDVYRRDTEAQRSYTNLLLYVSFFPQLIAGPIIRYKDIVLQIPNRHTSIKHINKGIFRFCIGLAKKVIIANNCGEVSKALLLNAENRAVLGLWVGILFFALQIYFDFSGYSDMAIGLGKIFGFEFKENFEYPYIAKSATEFWRRWHISLGTFFRDYVYIPLGGNRKRWLLNVFIVWFLTGLWHGASWNFVIWGLYYAFWLILEKKVIFPLFSKMNTAVSGIISYIGMFFITLFGWTIFYFTDFGELSAVLGGMIGFGGLPFTDIFADSLIRENIFLLIAALLASIPLFPSLVRLVTDKLDIKNGALTIIRTVYALILLFVSTAMLASSSYNPFLYFRF